MVSIMNRNRPSQVKLTTPERYAVTKNCPPKNFTPHFQWEEAAICQYLAIHYETRLDRVLLESRWINLAQQRARLWVKTWFNLPSRTRFLLVGYPKQAGLEKNLSKARRLLGRYYSG
jgi:hypothetical protein